MKHRIVEGRIAYTSRKPERMGQARGFETFMFTRHGDGKVTLRAHCEIEEPEPTVMRDVIYSLDERNQPMDLHVRLTVGDAFMGSGWMRFDGEIVECESFGPSIGRLSQRVAADLPVDGFGTHPIVADGFMLATKSWTHEGQRQQFRCYLPSPDHRGATPPMIAHVKIDGVYLGKEEVRVAAGTFATRHFQFVDPGDSGMGDHPLYDLWVTDDEDAIFVQGGVGGYMMTWYELAELRR